MRYFFIGFVIILLTETLYQEGDQKQGDDVEYFDHRVDGRSSRVFIRIADGVAGDGRFVRLLTLPAEVSSFNIFLSVVPSPTAARHGNGDEKTGYDRADQKSAEGNRP